MMIDKEDSTLQDDQNFTAVTYIYIYIYIYWGVSQC